MSLTKFLLAVPFFVLTAAGFAPFESTLLGVDLVSAAHAQSQSKVYELRTYTTLDGKLEDLKSRFRDHTIKIFASHDMVSVGYWTPQDGAGAAYEALLARCYDTIHAADPQAPTLGPMTTPSIAAR